MRRSVRAIAASIGPHGRALVYEPGPGRVALATDAVTIAREVADSDGIASIGGRILKETLISADRDLGDGAAGLAVVLGGIVEYGYRAIAAGHDPQRLAARVLALGGEVAGDLARETVAAPSAAKILGAQLDDPPLAAALASAIAQCGPDGVIEIKEQPGEGVDVGSGVGFTLDARLVSSAFQTEPAASAVELNNVFVLAANEIISDFGRLGPILEGFAERKKALVIVARDVAGAALQALVRNRRELGIHVVAMKPDDVSSRAALVIEDLAIATGATMIGAEVGLSLDSMRPTMLGSARRLSIERGRALFVSPGGDNDAIAMRRKLLAAEADRARYLAYDREHALRRAARLGGKWSEVRVGARNLFHGTARLASARAAVASTQSSLAAGVVAGGGAALVRIAARLRARRDRDGDRAARTAVAHGLDAVAEAVVRNTGREPRAILHELAENDDPGWGYDARTGVFGPVVSTGIADPAAITASLVARAISAAATLLTVGAAIGDSTIADARR
jgi:chaperonin GroEL